MRMKLLLYYLCVDSRRRDRKAKNVGRSRFSIVGMGSLEA